MNCIYVILTFSSHKGAFIRLLEICVRLYNFLALAASSRHLDTTTVSLQPFNSPFQPLSRPTTNHAHRSPPPIASALVYLRYYPALSTATNDNNGNGDGDDGDDDDEDENEDDVAIS